MGDSKLFAVRRNGMAESDESIRSLCIEGAQAPNFENHRNLTRLFLDAFSFERISISGENVHYLCGSWERLERETWIREPALACILNVSWDQE